MIFFDYDGVLVDSLNLCISSCKFAAKKLNFKGNFPENPYLNLNPVTYHEVARRLNLDGNEFDRLATSYVNKNLNSLKLFKGAKETLEILSKKHTLFVISSTKKEVVQNSLKNKGILNYFKEIYGGTDISKQKRLEIYATKNSIMIGDSISDMNAAKGAGVYAIGALWGWQSADMLKDGDVLVKDYAELLEAIRAFYN
ncbi:HAD family hydrolase [Campylobacter corcagiensis]|uniref:HAD family hydrolase n=1 Tax=Campylobacter corcagiensis TaxID=1448857 RepID=A0A7M1LG86_9BACT|nr:HAD family hydrolase [Campylobacter corcagiensis]QKF64196.1 phosphoglycolate phosphatase, HAD superfamily [Campylobacter corcagiensis]QOQ87609.1 HAD family hydrolase [Campylobacter corcagiensis]